MRKKTVTGETPIDETTLIQTAVDAFVKELGLDDDSLLSGKVEIREIPAGTYLMQEESHKVILESFYGTERFVSNSFLCNLYTFRLCNPGRSFDLFNVRHTVGIPEKNGR